MADGGRGRTVAIVDAFDDPNAENDLAQYRTANSLSPCTTNNGCFTKINQSGNTSPLPKADKKWTEEISLDLDMVSAACPNCSILLVEANSTSTSDLGTAEQTAFGQFPEAVSNSWGQPESSSELDSDKYMTPISSKTAVLAAAGDSQYGTGWPSTSPGVISVGGTELTRDTTTPRGWRETVWDQGGFGTGSGCSAYEPRPAWQAPWASACANRIANDISAVAYNIAAYDSYKTGKNSWITAAGTSASTPLISAMIALAGGYTNSASQLYQNWTISPTVANDVTSGSNGNCGTVGSSTYLLCNAVPGYDGPTGLGTPAGLGIFQSARNRILIAGNGDYGDTSSDDYLETTLKAHGYLVDRSVDVPSDTSAYSAVFWISTEPPTDAELASLESVTAHGGGVYLTGERPCCELLNQADESFLKAALTSAADAGVSVGGLGDPYYATGPLPINSLAPGGLAQIPNDLTTVTVSAPGGMIVPVKNVLASTDVLGTGTPIAAAWDRSDVTGHGRVVVLMDINWLESSYGDTTTAEPLAVNLATFLTGSAPPAPGGTVLGSPPNMAKQHKMSPAAAP